MLDPGVRGHPGDTRAVVGVGRGDPGHVRTVPPVGPSGAPVALVLGVAVPPVAVPRVVQVREEVVPAHRALIEVRVVDLARVRDSDHHTIARAVRPRGGHADVAGTPLVVPVAVVRGGRRVRREPVDHDQVRFRRFHGGVLLEGLDHCLLLRFVEHRVGFHHLLGVARGLDDLRVLDLGGRLHLGQDLFLLRLGDVVLELHHDPVGFRQDLALGARSPSEGFDAAHGRGFRLGLLFRGGPLRGCGRRGCGRGQQQRGDGQREKCSCGASWHDFPLGNQLAEAGSAPDRGG